MLDQKNGDGSWKASWKLLGEQSNCVLSYFKPHQRRVLTRSALVFLTGYETCWMKVGNCSGLPHCSNNPNNISSFSLSNHRHLSLPPAKQCFCASLCLCSWLEESSTVYLGWFYFQGMIISTFLCGRGLWDSVNIPLYLHTVPMPEYQRRGAALLSIAYQQGDTLETR